jgi:hypothetical protein
MYLKYSNPNKRLLCVAKETTASHESFTATFGTRLFPRHKHEGKKASNSSNYYNDSHPEWHDTTFRRFIRVSTDTTRIATADTATTCRVIGASRSIVCKMFTYSMTCTTCTFDISLTATSIFEQTKLVSAVILNTNAFVAVFIDGAIEACHHFVIRAYE